MGEITPRWTVWKRHPLAVPILLTKFVSEGYLASSLSTGGSLRVTPHPFPSILNILWLFHIVATPEVEECYFPTHNFPVFNLCKLQNSASKGSGTAIKPGLSRQFQRYSTSSYVRVSSMLCFPISCIDNDLFRFILIHSLRLTHRVSGIVELAELSRLACPLGRAQTLA